ncbi:MAG: PLDc N-terminal domain-containing protein [Gammaproteobacteria bacterium]|nr:PLDc N-terminal domain-containing protein [Gammaproteobacteria bacterium]
MEIGSLLGLVILVLDIFAILKVVQSGVPTINKVIWVIVILVLPVIGLLAWAIAGPRS